MTNEFRWLARLQQNDNMELQRAGGSQASRSPHRDGGREEGELERAMASVAAAVLARCGQPQSLFLTSSLLSRLCRSKNLAASASHATLPVIYTPPCYSLCSDWFFRKDNSHPGEEKPNCSISFLPQKRVISQASSTP